MNRDDVDAWQWLAERRGQQLVEAHKRIKKLEAAIKKLCVEDDPFEKERTTKSVMERKK